MAGNILAFDRLSYERRLAALDDAALQAECRSAIQRCLEWRSLERSAVICCQRACEKRGLDFRDLVAEGQARRAA